MKYLSSASLLLTLAAGACTGPRAHTPAPAESAAAEELPVAASQVTTRDLPVYFETGGIVRARLTATLASRVMAPVTAIHVVAGDRVRRGQALVDLDAREMRANRDRAVASSAAAEHAIVAADAGVAGAQASLALARATHQRIADLASKKSATTQELDQAVAALAGAEAQVRAAEAQRAGARSGLEAAAAASTAADTGLSYTRLNAPFDGIVSQRLVDPGTMATPGLPVLMLEDTTRFRVETTLDESRAAQVQVGTPVDVAIGGGADEPVWTPARVTEVARVDAASHAFVLKVDLPDGVNVRSGTFARVRLAGPSRRTLAAPASAIVRRGQLAFVFAVNKGVAHLRAVSTAAPQGAEVEVLAGLTDGEQVVTNPPLALTDGHRVRVSATVPTGEVR